MRTTLTKKLVLNFLVTVIGAILITAVIANYMIDKRFDDYLFNAHKKKVEKVRSLVEDLYNEQTGYSGSVAKEIVRYAILEDLYIEIKDLQGRVIFSSGQGHLMHKKMMGPMGQRQRWKRIGEYMEETYRLEYHDKNIGTLVIGYFGPWNLTERDIGFKNTLNYAFIISATAALVFGLIISFILSKQLTTPLIKITNTANEMKNGNLEIRSQMKSNTIEIEKLSQAMNYLAETLQQQEMIRKRLTADMAHEIRTPLTTLQTHVEAMMDGIWQPTRDRFKSCHEEIQRLTKLVDNLQDLAKLEQANLRLNKSRFDLSAEVEKMIESFKPQYEKKGLRFNVKIEPNLIVLMDKDKVKQILLNLLSNAYKYSNENGIVEVCLKRMEQVIQIAVKDKGIGIAKKDLPYIFERFYRGDISRHRETGGSGIGLTIVKTLVEAHGGEIRVESQLGKGSTFIIDFPKSLVIK